MLTPENGLINNRMCLTPSFTVFTSTSITRPRPSRDVMLTWWGEERRSEVSWYSLLHVKEGVLAKHQRVQGHTHRPHLKFGTQIAVGRWEGTKKQVPWIEACWIHSSYARAYISTYSTHRDNSAHHPWGYVQLYIYTWNLNADADPWHTHITFVWTFHPGLDQHIQI